MASSSETGHAKNIANGKKLTDIISGFGAAYSPNNPKLVLGTMQGQQAADDTLQQNVNTQNGIFQPLQNARVLEFKDDKKLARRVRSAAKASGADSQWNKDVNAIIRKILGERASKATPTPNDPAGTSASQQSFDNQVDHFDKLYNLLLNQPLYTPTEADLTAAAIQTKKNNMVTKNDAVKAGVVPFNLAIINRNKALYTRTTGLVDIFNLSKEYIKSAFGSTSPEYKLAVKCKFKNLVKIPT